MPDAIDLNAITLRRSRRTLLDNAKLARARGGALCVVNHP